MKDQFVPYELALRLKNIGFDEECLTIYEPLIYKDGWMLRSIIATTILHKTGQNNSHESEFTGYKNSVGIPYGLKSIAAPLWQQAFDWFRSKGKVIQLNIFDSYIGYDGYEEEGYYYKISDYDGWRGGLRDTLKGESYATIEESRYACLNDLISMFE